MFWRFCNNLGDFVINFFYILIKLFDKVIWFFLVLLWDFMFGKVVVGEGGGDGDWGWVGNVSVGCVILVKEC